MIFQQAVDTLARQDALDAPSRGLQGVVRRTYRMAGPMMGRRIANVLHGTWLGHSLHPALTDFVIGAWTAGVLFDTLDALGERTAYSRCADVSVGLGVATGLPTVLSGLIDWQYTASDSRRVGLVHGITNISAVLLQTASLVLRGLGARRTARIISGATYGALFISAYLGGELVGRYRLGVNRAPGRQELPGFVPVMAEADLPENQLRRVEVNGVPVLLVRQGDRIYAMHETCTHMGGPLSRGAVVDGAVQCPWHASRFALDDGHVVAGPAAFAEQCLATRVRNGQIEVGPEAGLGRCAHEAAPAAASEARTEMAGAPTMR